MAVNLLMKWDWYKSKYFNFEENNMNKKTLIKPLGSLLGFVALIIASQNLVNANNFTGYADKMQLASSVLSKKTRSDAQMLINAVSANRLSIVKQLVAEGVDINVPAIGDGTALMIAIGENNTGMIDGLLALGADVNQTSVGDGNPLIVAAKRGYLDIVKTLINQGAEVNGAVEGDETPLINASAKGRLAVVKYLVEQGADVNLAIRVSTLTGSKMRSPLNQAGSGKVREYLISQGAS